MLCRKKIRAVWLVLRAFSRLVFRKMRVFSDNSERHADDIISEVARENERGGAEEGFLFPKLGKDERTDERAHGEGERV